MAVKASIDIEMTVYMGQGNESKDNEIKGSASQVRTLKIMPALTVAVTALAAGQ